MYEVVSDTVGNAFDSPVANTIITYIESPALIIPLIMLLLYVIFCNRHQQSDRAVFFRIIIFYLLSMGIALTRKTDDLKRTLEIVRHSFVRPYSHFFLEFSFRNDGFVMFML